MIDEHAITMGEKYTTKIGGVIPALITPFDGDFIINESSLRALIRRLLNQNVDGFYVGGSTAEAFMLTRKERKRILEISVDETDKRVPVIYHVGSINTAEAVDLSKHAKTVGADAVSAIPPFYYGFSREEMIGYYRDISAVSDLPLIVYNFPKFSGVTIDTDTAAELFRDPKIIGIKHTAMDLHQLERMKVRHPQIRIINGHDEVFLGALSLGADGAIGSTYNIMAPLFIHIREAYRKGEMEEALQLQGKANGMIDALIECGVFAGIKHILTLEGIPCGVCRKPFLPPSPGALQRLEEHWQAIQAIPLKNRI